MKTDFAAATIDADALCFSAHEVHADAFMKISFQRTLRLPDDERDYPLPPGLGRLPLRPIERCNGTVPATWQRRGGVVLPMYQAEAMWLNFDSLYPFALKIAAGNINAITGKRWRGGLATKRQNYAVVPEQPWLDGFCVAKDVVRQFVAMPLGGGYTAEEQITGAAEWGGLRIEAFPMKREAYERMLAASMDFCEGDRWGVADCPPPCMGLAPGGRMRQQIYTDPHERDAWDLKHGVCSFVQIVNSSQWCQIVGEAPPHRPPTAADYTRFGLPWFEYFDENAVALEGSRTLSRLNSVEKLAKLKQEDAADIAESCTPVHVVPLKPAPTSWGAG